MKIAHLILAHKNPAQLERLLNALSHPAFHFFIHIDHKTDATPFAYLFKKENVYAVQQRTRIYWAGWGTIQATINGFREIQGKGYDYINVISAQDFPLKSAASIFAYLEQRRGTEFITCESIDSEWREAAPRIRKYHLINWRIPGKFRIEKLVNRILPERKFPLDHAIVGRANWFTLTEKAVAYCLDCIDRHPEVVRYYKYCWGADEFIFSTILFNSPFREKIQNNLVYVDWSRPESKGHPKILRSEDLERLSASEKLFARKFDADKDSRILASLEALIGVSPAGS